MLATDSPLAGFGFAVTENCVRGAGTTSPSQLLKLHLRQDKTRYVIVGKEQEHDACAQALF